jgi:hypothetical protein
MVHVTFGITIHMSHISSWHGKHKWRLFDAFKWAATVRFGSVWPNMYAQVEFRTEPKI